jgi:hypothetical protein
MVIWNRLGASTVSRNTHAQAFVKSYSGRDSIIDSDEKRQCPRSSVSL